MVKKLPSEALPNIFSSLKLLNEARGNYPDIKDAIKYVSYKINEDYAELADFLETTGAYVPEDSEAGKLIQEYVNTRKDMPLEELIDNVAFRYVIATPEARRLVEHFQSIRKNNG